MSTKIIWVDDEINLLRSHILFLEDKGYEVVPITNGQDAIEACQKNAPDVVFLDENMPGLSGLETLAKIKSDSPGLPVVMITKSEEENIMEDAIGSQITDYLIKPVNPHQILLTLKKITDNKRLVREKTASSYQQEFQAIFSSINEGVTYKDWQEIYKKLVYWELELQKSNTTGMSEVLTMQKSEANTQFFKFINNKYLSWLAGEEEAPVMSHNLFKTWIQPIITDKKPTFLVLIDNLRYDQWKIIQPVINNLFKFEREDSFFSILPTTTQYSRNAIFAGLTPAQIEKKYPTYWRNDADEGGKNNYEAELLKEQLSRLRLSISHSYTKVTNHQSGRELEQNALNLLNNNLNVVVYNFVDMLSHARTEMEVLKELASDEAAYRSITASWFEHSPLHNFLKKLAGKDIQLVITTDHGTVKVKQPSKVIGDKNTTTNLRYKEGKNLQYEPKDVLEVTVPEKAALPRPNMSSRYIFAKEDKYFVYPNNYNHFVNYFKDTFQHGGVSMEEMIVPFAIYNTK